MGEDSDLLLAGMKAILLTTGPVEVSDEISAKVLANPQQYRIDIEKREDAPTHVVKVVTDDAAVR